MNNVSQQAEEIEVLNSIYEDLWKYNPHVGYYSIEVSPNVTLLITLTPEYPSQRPPKYELLAPFLTRHQTELLAKEFQLIFEENIGSPILFQWIEKLKDIVSLERDDDEKEVAKSSDGKESPELGSVIEKEHASCNYDIFHGPIIQDRKSIFQGHACRVYDVDIVRDVMKYLKENKKIANATHNITAYRIQMKSGATLQDCDDDGENHAGRRVLHLLEILNITNVLVVVSRWYGGIHLGPDRFKHINNAARQVLRESGFIS